MLEQLWLSYLNLSYECAQSAATKMSAPRLKCLTIGFSSEDQHDTPSDAVNHDWLLAFVKIWRASRLQEQDSFQRIHLEFCPELPCYTDPMPEWPWGYLDTVTVDLEKYGVRLTWPKPKWTEKQWVEEIWEIHEAVQATIRDGSWRVRSEDIEKYPSATNPLLS